jgi:hypothetical protein
MTGTSKTKTPRKESSWIAIAVKTLAAAAASTSSKLSKRPAENYL